MNLFVKLLNVGGLLMVSTACGNAQEATSTATEPEAERVVSVVQEVPEVVSVSELNALLAQANPDVVLLDVRTPSEIADGYIKECQILSFSFSSCSF